MPGHLQQMKIRHLLAKLNLRYNDPSEEKEYTQIKLPLLQDFFIYILICIAGLLTILTVHLFFFLHLTKEAITSFVFLILAFMLFIVRKKLGKWMEYLVVAYLLGIVAMIIINLSQVLLSLKSCESFYSGYSFALLHRILGYRVVKLHNMIIFHLVSLILRLILLYDHGIWVSLMVTAVEVCTVLLSAKSEMGERVLFDSLYKSKKQLLKFKDFMTEHLPNQMVIFSKDYSSTHFINNTFRKTFQCDDLSKVKMALSALTIEKETLEKNSVLFENIISGSKGQPIKLSHFLSLLSKSNHLLRESEILTFQVYDSENFLDNPVTSTYRSSGDSFVADTLPNQYTTQRNKESTPKESLATDSVGTPKMGQNATRKKTRVGSHAYLMNGTQVPDVLGLDPYPHETKLQETFEERGKMLGEEGRRIFKVKMFMLPWDGEEAIVLVLDDVTHQRMIMELRIADKNKDLVIATVSHELRTPLNGMLGIIEILKKMVDDSEVVGYLNACKNSGLFLLNLVNSILDMSQIKNNKLKLTYTEVNIEGLLGEVKSLFESFCSTKKLYLNVDIAKNVPSTICTDKSRISQIIINLVGNAFKFTFDGGITIKVQVEKVAPLALRFSIQDSGLGIKREDQDKLFRLFGRLEQHDQKINTNGVGLGLTISNTLAVLLNTSEKQGIRVDSELGAGSCFSFLVESQSENDADKIEEESPYILGLHSDEDLLPLTSKLNQYKTSVALNFDRMRGSKRFATCRELATSFESSDDATSLKQRASIDLQKSTRLQKQKSKTAVIIAEEQKNLKNLINASASKDIDKPWCLIVDDNPFNIMVARHILEENRYKVKTALNGKEAIEEVVNHQNQGGVFKAILMDCQMPIMSGYEATQILREMMKNEEIDECPIFALSANSRDGGHEELWKKVGMSGCIEKPLRMDELEAMLENMGNRKSS